MERRAWKRFAAPGEPVVDIRQIAGIAARFIALAACFGAPLTCALPGQQGQGPIIAANPAPTPEQIRSLTARAIENQHKDDAALQEYERTEHFVSRKIGRASCRERV